MFLVLMLEYISVFMENKSRLHGEEVDPLSKTYMTAADWNKGQIIISKWKEKKALVWVKRKHLLLNVKEMDMHFFMVSVYFSLYERFLWNSEDVLPAPFTPFIPPTLHSLRFPPSPSHPLSLLQRHRQSWANIGGC